MACCFAEGIDVLSLPTQQREFVLPVAVSSGPWSCKVGRQHQPSFFEGLVLDKERLASISRSHFELSLEPPASFLVLRKLSGNPLLLNDCPLVSGEVVVFPEHGRISFSGTSPTDPVFLTLQLSLGNDGQANRCVASMPPEGAFRHAPTEMRPAAPRVVLECTKCINLDPTTLPRELRTIVLWLQQPLDIGRQHQPHLFDTLLQQDSFWLSFISRSHCRVLLCEEAAVVAGCVPQLSLRVKNLSHNPVFISGRPLAKRHSDVLALGDVIYFVAKGKDQKDTVFLQFALHQA